MSDETWIFDGKEREEGGGKEPDKMGEKKGMEEGGDGAEMRDLK